MKAIMTHEEKVGFMNIAASLCNLAFKPEHLDLLVSLYEEVCNRGGEMTLSDTVQVEKEVKKRANVRSRQDLLDKVSEKID